MLDQRDKAAIESLLDGHITLATVIYGMAEHCLDKARESKVFPKRGIWEIRYEHLQRFYHSL